MGNIMNWKIRRIMSGQSVRHFVNHLYVRCTWAFLFLSLIGCIKEKRAMVEAVGEQKPGFYKIADFDLKSEIDLAPYLKSVKYVKLELNDQSILGEIQHLEAFEDRLYILDNVTGKIFVFTIEGKFLFVLDKVGQGPGEYAQIDYFSIDRNERQIFVADLMTNTILRYDLDGRFISRQKVPCWVDGIYPIENKEVVLFANYRNNSSIFDKQHNILIMDSLSNIKSCYFPYPSDEISQMNFMVNYNGGFIYNGKTCMYYNRYEDTVYSVSNGVLTPEYVFDFGEKKFDRSYLAKDVQVLKDYIESRNYNLIHLFNETEDYVYYNVNPMTGMVIYGLFSKKTGNNLYTYFFADGDERFFPGFGAFNYGSSFIFYMSADILLSDKERYDEKGWPDGKFTDKKREFVNTLSEDDNPVLIFYEFDNF